MKDDEMVVMFCHPNTAIEFLGGEDAEVIQNSIVMSLLLPEGEVTIASRDEFLEWLEGKERIGHDTTDR